MLQCAPYIKSICQNNNNHLWADEENMQSDQNQQQSLSQKKDSEIRITYVKGYEVMAVDSVCVVNGEIVKDYSDLYKVIKKIRPDSPDVIRAAKRFEQTRKNLKSNVNNGLETIVEQSPEPTRKNPVNHQFGARSKINRCNL